MVISPFGAKEFAWISGQDGLRVQIPVAFYTQWNRQGRPCLHGEVGYGSFNRINTSHNRQRAYVRQKRKYEEWFYVRRSCLVVRKFRRTELRYCKITAWEDFLSADANHSVDEEIIRLQKTTSINQTCLSRLTPPSGLCVLNVQWQIRGLWLSRPKTTGGSKTSQMVQVSCSAQQHSNTRATLCGLGAKRTSSGARKLFTAAA
jgi:hypothetical protein